MPFILILIGLILIIYNYKMIKKESIPFEIVDDKKDDFKSVLSESKDNLDDYKMELGILRRNIGESLTELQQEILEIKNDLNNIKKYSNSFEDKNVSYFANDEKFVKREHEDANVSNDHIVSEIHFSRKNLDGNKTEYIKELLKEGFSDEEICYKLSISKGEVLLVKDLFKK